MTDISSVGVRSGTVRVVVFGTGTVGNATIELCASRPWIDVVGVVNTSGAAVTTGRSIPVGLEGVSFSLTPDEVLAETKPDVALIATRSPITEVLPDIERCANRGIAVICTSEELPWPSVTSLRDAEVLRDLAARTSVAIVATGINPGFVFDALPLVLASGSWDISQIHVSRSLDASVFGQSVHRSLGVGYDPSKVHQAIADGTVRGHIGFEESARTIAAGMGLVMTRFEEHIEPVIADRPYELREYRIEPGETAGVTQTASAWVGDTEWITFDLSLHVDPESVGWETVDRITITGRNPMDVVIHSGTQAVLTTAARLVNTIPAVLSAPPGTYTGSDLLPNPPWFGDAVTFA